MGKLYLVGTPIGNLGDITPRAAEVLRSVDFIAAEDTRVSVKLLNHLGIKKPMVSYHAHNFQKRGEEILNRILDGEDCAVVTDAGMPCVSDPGEELVALCAASGVEVVAVPGPSAAITALALSGLPASRFAFEGFLSVSKTSRRKHLNDLKEVTYTLIFYEAPHKLPATLEDLLETLGDRRIALCRELTKLHEEVVRTTLSEAAVRYRQTPPRGEFVLVVEGARPKQEERVSLEEALLLVRRKMENGQSASRAAREAARETGYPRSGLYRMAQGGAEKPDDI